MGMRIFKVVIFTALLFVSLGLLSFCAFASELIDTSKSIGFTLEYKVDNVKVNDLNIKLYRIADISDEGSLSLTKDFAEYKDIIKISDLSTSAGLKVTAETLAEYVTADKVSPTMVGKTEGEGRTCFSDIKPGLFLVLSDEKIVDETVFVFEPFIISLPYYNENGEVVYSAIATPKGEREPYKPDDSKITYRIIKCWKDEGNLAKRPNKINVDIYKNGVFHSSTTLSEENDWKFVWSEKNDGSKWTVVERNTDKVYKVSISREGTDFVVTNTYYVPTDSPVTSKGGTPKGSLPQTGQLWWPVMLLSIVGLLLFAVGWRILRCNKDND